MIRSVVCLSGALKDRHFNIHDVLSIGSAWTADIRLPVRDAASLHCCIARQPDGELLLIDLASPRGTLVNGKRVTRHRLAPGERFLVGRCEFEASTPVEDADEATIQHGRGYSSRPPSPVDVARLDVPPHRR